MYLFVNWARMKSKRTNFYLGSFPLLPHLATVCHFQALSFQSCVTFTYILKACLGEHETTRNSCLKSREFAQPRGKQVRSCGYFWCYSVTSDNLMNYCGRPGTRASLKEQKHILYSMNIHFLGCQSCKHFQS